MAYLSIGIDTNKYKYILILLTSYTNVMSSYLQIWFHIYIYIYIYIYSIYIYIYRYFISILTKRYRGTTLWCVIYDSKPTTNNDKAHFPDTLPPSRFAIKIKIQNLKSNINKPTRPNKECTRGFSSTQGKTDPQLLIKHRANSPRN